MNTNVGFPTLGELVQFTYDAFGVLPRKRGIGEDGIDETQKKSIQKALSRLSDEEGNINENIGDLIRKLAYLVAGFVTSPRANFVIGESLMDIFELYKAVLREEGTYLNKVETVRWLIDEYIVGSLVFSIKEHSLRFNLSADNFASPESFWYLPTIENDRVVYPLEKAITWIYEQSKQTQRQFHSRSSTNPISAIQQERNLENAQNWKLGRSLPSASELIWTFDYSIELLNKANNADDSMKIDKHMQENFRLILFIARASTFIFKQIVEIYGISFTHQICEKFKNQSANIDADFEHFESHLKRKLIRAYLPSLLDEICQNETHQFVSEYASSQTYFERSLKAISFEEQHEMFEDAQKLKHLEQQFGKFSVSSIAEKLLASKVHEPPNDFAKFVLEGIDLKNDKDISLDAITRYESDLNTSNLKCILPWMTPWMKGAYHYRRQEYKSAFPFFQEAFSKAQYCAGNNQYKLVNQFVEVAAKNKQRKAFNKAISWAQYLGIEIRWLRKDPPTEEKLDFVFAIMQKAEYGAL